MSRATPRLARSLLRALLPSLAALALGAPALAAYAQAPDAGAGGAEAEPGSPAPEVAPPDGSGATPGADTTEAEGASARDPDARPELRLSERALSAGSGASDPGDPSGEGEDDEPILRPSDRPRPSDDELEAEEEGVRATAEPDGDPAIVDDDMELPPDPPDLPEFRLRAGAGVALPTAGEFALGLRLTQEFEWQPPPLDPIFFALGGAEVVGAALVGYAHLRAGLRAWFCDERPVRCQAAIALVGGAAFGRNLVAPNFAGDTDLRFLFWDWLELHVRGGFSFLQEVPFIDITGGLGVAF